MSDYLPWTVEHMAAEEMQKDWNDLRFQSVFHDAYESGGNYVKHYADKEITRLKAELDALREQVRWRDVREELPEHLQNIVFRRNSRRFFNAGFFDRESIRFESDSEHEFYDACEVDRWLPIPAHPTTPTDK